MKKYSTYYVVMIVLATAFMGLGWGLIHFGHPNISALMFTVMFILGFSAAQAPAYEKYSKRELYRRSRKGKTISL